MQLSEIIIDKIETEGPLSFRDFMDMALYYPGLGYYTSAKEKIGKQGDYFTSPTLTPLFGFTLAKQIEEMFEKTGTDDFTIVEYGAGTGALCESILNYISQRSNLDGKINYCIIEKSEAMKRKEKEKLGNKVKWVEQISDLKNFNGCVLSNELVDNFPVHLVEMKDELMEIFVDYDGKFIETLRPAGEKIKNYFSELKVELPKGFRAEVNLQATDWMKEIGENMNRGFVITIDYGYPSAELYSGLKKNGTLTCYRNHKINELPFAKIGEQDITAHVNFSALCLWGFRHGLNLCGFRPQSDFLIALGFKEHLKKLRQNTKDFVGLQTEAFLSHTFLTEMSRKFKVLIQRKQVETTELKGLQPI